MCNNKCGGCLLAIAIGIIVGIIVGILFFLAIIPGSVLALRAIFVFALAVVGMIVISGAWGKRDIEKCVCFKGRCALALALLTILATVLALALPLVTANIAFAILAAIVTTLFIATLIAVFQLVSCIVTANCKCRETE